jgi:hypothetical protein
MQSMMDSATLLPFAIVSVTAIVLIVMILRGVERAGRRRRRKALEAYYQPRPDRRRSRTSE